MNRSCLVLAILVMATSLWAQTNEPVRLALVPEPGAASEACDLLTAQLSANSKVQLLERAEIEKVYHEQGMSATDTDDLKLGHLLGTDGLLLVDAVKMSQWTTNLKVRLVAVKPGVILLAETFSWPIKDVTDWSLSFAGHLDSYFPKLSVLDKDAVPISVVNLRSAVSSSESAETERELKLLTIQRLSQERQFFVLERQKMQSLAEEKDLKSDESAFWNGSYLLDGVVDRNGHSKDTITIDGRLTPPKGGQPIQFEVSGSRTNLAEVVNQLAAKVACLLQVKTGATEWNAADEAGQYYNEAKWALHWGIYSEAQAAADSAWALGKNDLDCALVRVRAYVAGIDRAARNEKRAQDYVSPSFNADGKPTSPLPTEATVQEEIKEIRAEQPYARIINIAHQGSTYTISYLYSDQPPDDKNIDFAIYALELYDQFSRTANNGGFNVLWQGKGWNSWSNSDWYQLGIDDLAAASRVLQSFNLLEAQKPVADRLAELRAMARSVARTITTVPSVHDSYFVGDRIANHDELYHTMREHDTIFGCEVQWGCYWQERPEDDLALYRELMGSPVFCYIHGGFWQRPGNTPRLVAWNDEDEKRIPVIWADFVRELEASTNVLWQMEAQGLARAGAENDGQIKVAESAWWGIVHQHHDELVGNNVELFYLGWGFADNAETEALDQEYWQKTIPARDMVSAFDQQKQYLASLTPFDFKTFNQIFQSRNYTKAQAAEIQPLAVAYESNLLAKVASLPSMTAEKLKAQNNARWVEFFLEQQVNAVLNPPPPAHLPANFQPPSPPVPPAASQLPAVASNKSLRPAPAQSPEVISNVMLVDKFLAIPLAGLPGDKISAVMVRAHHWMEGRLLLDFQYNAFIYTFANDGSWKSTRSVTLPAIAVLDPETEHWQVIRCPEVDLMTRTRFYHHTVLWRGELYTSDGGKIRRYDFPKQQWENLLISMGENCELFVINDRLYGANSDMIFEIIGGGKATHILASSRRQPPVSALDTQNLGTPILFAGPGHTLRVSTSDAIYTWSGGDWSEDATAPVSLFPPELSPEGLLFRFASGDRGSMDSVSWLSNETKEPELRIGPVSKQKGGRSGAEPVIFWRPSTPGFIENTLAGICQSNLYFFAGHSVVQEITNSQHVLADGRVIARDGYNASMMCFCPGFDRPQEVFLKCEGQEGCPPLARDIVRGDKSYLIPQPAMVVFGGDNLFFAPESPIGPLPIGLEGLPASYKPGVWVLPTVRLFTAVAAQQQTQLKEIKKTAVAAEQSGKDFLTKYDRNHDGVIDSEEREEALDDPDFIKSELDRIDTNHNGWLDPSELAYFDANQNHALDPKEQAAIDIACRLLAGRLVNRFDADEKGWLIQREYSEMIQTTLHINDHASSEFQFPHVDDNHDWRIEPEELGKALKRHLELELDPELGIPGRNRMVFDPMNGRQRRLGEEEQFKEDVESYWQYGDHTHWPSYSDRMRFNPGFIPGPNANNQSP